MFCSKCGKEIMDEAVICPHCGCATKTEASPVKGQKTNVFACIGFVFSLFFVIVEILVFSQMIGIIWFLKWPRWFFVIGLILASPSLAFSIIGYKKAPKYNNSDKGLPLFGIIISCVGIAFVILEFIGTVAAYN